MLPMGCRQNIRQRPYGKFMTVRRDCLIARFCLCIGVVAACQAYPTFTWELERLAEAPVLATCVVQQTSRDSSPVAPGKRVVWGHATLRVLRSFPESAMPGGERIRLDYEALPEGVLGGSGPDVPSLKPGSVLVLPLKLNPRPSMDAWRLIADEGDSLVIPAILRKATLANVPTSGRDYVLQEIASALGSGIRAEVFAEAQYLSRQRTAGYAPELMRLLEPRIGADENRLSLIAASLISSLGVPRPTVADFQSGMNASGANGWAGSLIHAVFRKLGGSARAKERLIHQLLANSDIAAWGVGVTLREFAQEPSLTRELRTMLESRRPWSLSVAYAVLSAGQKEILEDAITLALLYVHIPGKDTSELQPACWIIRDFGSDQQFSQFLGTIRKYQYLDTRHYDELWRNTIWSSNNRERAVLEILLADQRVYQANYRYSDIARGELARMQAAKSPAR